MRNFQNLGDPNYATRMLSILIDQNAKFGELETDENAMHVRTTMGTVFDGISTTQGY